MPAAAVYHRRPKEPKKITKDFAGGLVYISRERMRIEDVPEDQLIRNAQSGDAQSFEILFDRYYDMIHAFAYRVCLVDTESEDLAQETFIRAARGLSAYRGTASFKNWLFRIAHHVVIDWHRQRARQRDKEAAFQAELQTQTGLRTPDHDEVHGAMLELSPELREAVALVYFENMNHREAAAAMGCAETTISWRIFRAKLALRKLLGPKKGTTP